MHARTLTDGFSQTAGARGAKGSLVASRPLARLGRFCFVLRRVSIATSRPARRTHKKSRETYVERLELPCNWSTPLRSISAGLFSKSASALFGSQLCVPIRLWRSEKESKCVAAVRPRRSAAQLPRFGGGIRLRDSSNNAVSSLIFKRLLSTRIKRQFTSSPLKKRPVVAAIRIGPNIFPY